MTKKLKKKLIRIIVCLIAFIAVYIINKTVIRDDTSLISYITYIAVYVAIAYDVVFKAFKKIANGKVIDENFLMVIASIGAFFISEGSEGVGVMLFFQIGEWFQSYAVGKSRASIKELMNIRPDYANVIRDGEEVMVDPSEVEIGETIIIKPGEKVPIDSEIIEGDTTLDTKALTGESVPREVLCGEQIISGCINLTKVVKARTNKRFGESTVSKILEMVENATSKKAQTENFITVFARYYTPIIVGLATLVCVIPTVFFHGVFFDWLYRALSFLVISCPCALVISIPLGFFGGIGGAGKAGILVKGSNYLELLAKTEIVVMDKTGTLTEGTFEVCDVVTTDKNVSKEALLELAALAESYSGHPISKSLVQACEKELDITRLGEVEEIAGHGIVASIDSDKILVGNKKLMDAKGIECPMHEEIGTICYVANENKILGYITIADKEKKDAKRCIEELKDCGIKEIVMLTGDRENTAKSMSNKLGIDRYYAELLPIDKVEKVEEIYKEKSKDGKLVFVGDGINDAPVLARADIGIAMGGLGSDAAIEAADIVIMTDEPSKISTAMRISRRTLRIVKENIAFALGVKVLVLILATLGFTTMWAAVFADVGVAFLAILNSMRALNVKKIM